MDSRLWRDTLKGDLRRQGLPAAYIDRLIEELADHTIDLQTEDTSMEAQQAYERLGTTEQLAAAANQEFRRRTFASRYPVLTFVLGPVAFVPAIFIMMLLLAFGIAWIIGSTLELVAGDKLSQIPEQANVQLEFWILWCFNGYARFIPFALASWIFCRWGQRTSMRRWALVACGIVAVMAGIVFTKTTPATGNSPGLYMLGLTFNPNLRQLIQILVPLAVGGWFLLRVPQSSPQAPTAGSFLPETLQRL